MTAKNALSPLSVALLEGKQGSELAGSKQFFKVFELAARDELSGSVININARVFYNSKTREVLLHAVNKGQEGWYKISVSQPGSLKQLLETLSNSQDVLLAGVSRVLAPVCTGIPLPFPPNLKSGGFKVFVSENAFRVLAGRTGHLVPSRVAALLSNPSASGFEDNGKSECASFVHTTLTYLSGLDYYLHTLEERNNAMAPKHWRYHAGLFGVNPSKNAWEFKDSLTSEINKGKLVFWSDKGVKNPELPSPLRSGDIVCFYYPASRYNKEAEKQGAGYTHVGLVIGVTDEGEPVVAHLFHARATGIRIETLNEALHLADDKGAGLYVKAVLRPNFDYWLEEKDLVIPRAQ